MRRPQDGNGSALHDACIEQSPEIVEVLLLAGGCRFLCDAHGHTPLDCAGAHKGVIKVFFMLGIAR